MLTINAKQNRCRKCIKNRETKNPFESTFKRNEYSRGK